MLALFLKASLRSRGTRDLSPWVATHGVLPRFVRRGVAPASTSTPSRCPFPPSRGASVRYPGAADVRAQSGTTRCNGGRRVPLAIGYRTNRNDAIASRGEVPGSAWSMCCGTLVAPIRSAAPPHGSRKLERSPDGASAVDASDPTTFAHASLCPGCRSCCRRWRWSGSVSDDARRGGRASLVLVRPARESCFSGRSQHVAVGS